MYPTVNLDTAMTALAALLNQKAIPAALTTQAQFFIISATSRVLRGYDFGQTLSFVSVTTDASGLVDLSTVTFGGVVGVPIGLVPAIEGVNDGTQGWAYTDVTNFRLHKQGEFRYTLKPDSAGTKWYLHSTEPNATIHLFFYDHSDISSTKAVPLPPMLIARGALIYYRAAQDPEADTSTEEDQFRQEFVELVEFANRRKPQQFARSPYDQAGRAIGD